MCTELSPCTRIPNRARTWAPPRPAARVPHPQPAVLLAALALVVMLPLLALGRVEVMAHVPLWQPRIVDRLPWQLVAAYNEAF